MRQHLSATELAELELRLLGLLPDSAAGPFAVRVPVAPATGEDVLLEDRGGTPVGRLTVDDVHPDGDGFRVAGRLAAERPFQDGIARDRRATGPLDGTATLAGFSAPPSAEALVKTAEAARPLRTVALVNAGDDDRDVWQLLGAIETGTGTRPELVVLPDDVTGTLRTTVLASLAGGAQVLDATGPAVGGRVGGGVVVLLTGLSGSGKSTIARALADHLHRTDHRVVTLLDGDEVRRHLSSGLGFSAEDRRTNLLRIAWVAALAARHGGIALCAPIAPYAAVRAEMRSLIEPSGRLVLVHVATPLEVCEARDRKGLYARARAGEIRGFTGIDDPYEAPTDADLVLDTSVVPVDEAVARISAVL
jgi:sulfate adenylyltransferase